MTIKEKELVNKLLQLLSEQTMEMILYGTVDVVTERDIHFVRKELGLSEDTNDKLDNN